MAFRKNNGRPCDRQNKHTWFDFVEVFNESIFLNFLNISIFGLPTAQYHVKSNAGFVVED